jgi:hypothetical protein
MVLMGASSSAARARSMASAPAAPTSASAHALTQLAGGLLGERDRGHCAHVAAAQLFVEHALDVAIDEHAGLAGAGPGLEQKRGAEVAGDAVADVLVADHSLSRHRRSPLWGRDAAGSRRR